jgi:prepilin-type processing-associated H-X9-DG protein
MSLNYYLLPHLEQDAIYNLIVTGQASAFTGFFGHSLKFQECPSETSGPDPYWPVRARGNYAANYQVFGNYRAGDIGDSAKQGFVYENMGGTPVLPDTFAHGSSSTILFGEKFASCPARQGAKACGEGGSLWAWLAGGDFINYLPFFAYGSPNPAPSGTPYSSGFYTGGTIHLREPGGTPEAGSCAAVETYQGSVGAASKFQLQPSAQTCDFTRLQTPHPAGMNVCMADGSVPHLSASIDPNVWWWLCITLDRAPPPGEW